MDWEAGEESDSLGSRRRIKCSGEQEQVGSENLDSRRRIKAREGSWGLGSRRRIQRFGEQEIRCSGELEEDYVEQEEYQVD